MILWLAGPSGAGKTTLAARIANARNTVWLDADIMRKMWPDLGYTKEDRENSCRRMATWAKYYENKGMAVIISAIAPYKALRDELAKKFEIKFLCLDHKGAKRRKDDEKFEFPDNLKFDVFV